MGGDSRLDDRPTPSSSRSGQTTTTLLPSVDITNEPVRWDLPTKLRKSEFFVCDILRGVRLPLPPPICLGLENGQWGVGILFFGGPRPDRKMNQSIRRYHPFTRTCTPLLIAVYLVYIPGNIYYLLGCSSPLTRLAEDLMAYMRFAQTMPTWSMKTRRAPPRHL